MSSNLVPEDKFDIASVYALKKAKPIEIIPISRSLLEWIADINWPVAQLLVEVLPIYHRELLPEIKYVLSDRVNDSIWKYSILNYLVSNFPKETILLLEKELSELTKLNPRDEDESDVVEISSRLLNQILSYK
jgi:hypothetical protein